MGRTTAYKLDPLVGPDTQGFSGLYVDNAWPRDALQYRASTQLLKQMWHLQPRDKEMGNGHGMTATLPTWEAKEQIEAVPLGVTNIPRTGTTPITLPRWTTREAKSYDNQGKKIPWAGNQYKYIERALNLIKTQEEINKTKKMQPLRYWIIINTKQGILPQW